MSNGAKKQIDWVKYAGLGLAVASFFFFQAKWKQAQQQAAEAQKAYQAQLEEAEKKKALKPEKPADATKKDATPTKTDDAAKKAVIKNGDPVVEAPKENKPSAEPEVSPDDIKVVNEFLGLTFSAKGAGLASGWLADQYVSAKARKEDAKGLELLGRIHPEEISLGMPYAKFGDQEFTDLENRVWFLEENSKSFIGDNNVWTVAYSTTLYEKNAPYKPRCKVIKRFKIGQTARHVETEIEVKNLTEEDERFQYSLRGAAGIFMDRPSKDPNQGGGYLFMIKSILAGRPSDSDSPEITIVPARKVATCDLEDRMTGATGGNLWATLSNRFFTTIMVARSPEQVANITAEELKPDPSMTNDPRYKDPNQSVVFKTLSTRDVAAKGEISDGYCLFMGPMKQDLLEEYEAELGLEKPVRLDLAIQYLDMFGWRWANIDRLARLMLGIFRFIASFAGYGIAVILLTMVVKICLHPFTRKMTVSMHKMQMLQPKLKAIEEKYAGQTKPEMKQKKEMEKWDLMKKEGANPASGCLPMFIQMPIFFAIYGVFSRAFEIRQADFLWISDLSMSDRLFTLSFWPNELNLLPLIYVALSITQMRLQPKPANADPQQEMSRKMMSYMPVVFGFLFYKMPAGLVLYFAAQSIFSFFESWYVKRYVLKVDLHGKPLDGSSSD